MRFVALIALSLAFLGAAHDARAAGLAKVAFDGGTSAERAAVQSALGASSFDWSILPQAVTVHIGAYGSSYSTVGNVYLDASLLDSGRYGWGVVQHEFGHQVDFFLLTDAERAQLQQQLGGADWCWTDPSLAHDRHGCERFASELAWAYWPSAQNSMSPANTGGESAGMPVAQFRAELAQMIGATAGATAQTPAATTAYAPVVHVAKPKKRRI